MCGVIGLRCEKDRSDLGSVASKLLRMLEYRGYDSTGALIQNEAGELVLRKDVGSPTVVTEKLNIYELQGKIFCGQVRWATFGSVDKPNAQPHQMKCKGVDFYGAHNGNITNCAQLKEWLIKEGHDVKSDNDGEMLVHMVEHYFAEGLEAVDKNDNKARAQILKSAVQKASSKIIGSYAAVVVDPTSQTMAGIKGGSSFYIGQGTHEEHGAFILASSDLASILSQTNILYPIKENEYAIFDSTKIEFYNLTTGKEIRKKAQRSKLKVEETELKKPYKYFMEQEIFSQIEATQKVISLFTGSYDVLKIVKELAKKNKKTLEKVVDQITDLSNSVDEKILKKEAKNFFKSKDALKIREEIKKLKYDFNKGTFESSYSTFLADLLKLEKGDGALLKFIDALFLANEVTDIDSRIEKFVLSIFKAHKEGKKIYFVACGTSFNAAKAASVFFNYFVGLNITAYLPGDFRASVSNSIQNGDVIIGISQSGETKDLIDIYNQVEESKKKTVNITILNNINSTLALEKCSLYIPLFCGPEIAVPATKSFINQLVVLYLLAIKTSDLFKKKKQGNAKQFNYEKALSDLNRVPALIKETISSTEKDIEKIANELYSEPSMHILATGMYGIAREGALKVREVVLNHTEGFEAPEFKHGPNTILGVNTVFGLDSVKSLLKRFNDILGFSISQTNTTAQSAHKLYKACVDYAFEDLLPSNLNKEEETVFKDIFNKFNVFDSLYTNYPLLFVTGPNSRDVNLTISQINTHKIRGANIYIIAEENEYLRTAISRTEPTRYEAKYKYGYIVLPKTNTDLLSFFTSSIVLQVLALKMSIKKMNLLDKLEIIDHGVHPDAPKNVSKSITVD